MLDLLQNTTNQIFNLYKQYGKSWYNFSLFYCLTVGLFGIILAAGTWKLAYYIHGYSLEPVDFFSYGIYDFRFIRISQSLFALSFGMYALYLFKKLNGEDQTPSLKDFFNTIKTNVLTDFVLLSFFVAFIYLITFTGVFSPDEDVEENNRIMGLIDGFARGSSPEVQLYNWLNSLIFLLRDYLCYPLAGILFLKAQNSKISREMIMQFKYAFLSILIIFFCIDQIAGGVSYLLTDYVFEGVRILFRHEILILPVQILINFIVISCFYLSFAGAVLFSVFLNQTVGAKDSITEEVKKSDIFQ